MATHQQLVDMILGKLAHVQGNLGCMVVSKDGEVMGSRLDRRFARDEIAAMVCDMVGMCHLAAEQCNLDRPDTMMIEGEASKIAVFMAERDIGYIFLLGKPGMLVGMSKIVLGEILDEFEKE